jgi:D-alanyl-D-alanine carboxypeptidase
MIRNKNRYSDKYSAKYFAIFCVVLLCVSFIPLAAQNVITEKEIQKLKTALAALPEKTRHKIADGYVKEFLADLEKVLSSDSDDLLRLVDKNHALSNDYVPPDIVPLVKNDFYEISRADLSLRKPAEAALKSMGEAALKDGVTLLVSSTYRSYEHQIEVYNRNVLLSGKETADRESAQPGKSQHQLGTAVDFDSISDAFVSATAREWLNTHAGEYGWSLSFPLGYEDETGYRWESWHYRYIGVEAVRFQRKWFSNIQQFMLEFIDKWKEM